MSHLWFIFHENNLLLQITPEGKREIPMGENPPVSIPEENTTIELPHWNEIPCKAICIDHFIENENSFEFVNLRYSFNLLDPSVYSLAGKAYELLYWDKNTHFCGICGHKMQFKTVISKVCEHCGKEIWPQLSPAMIILIHRGKDEVLLVQSLKFKKDYYGLVAGFVETGETIEECIEREIWEETQLKVKNIRYFGSQSWPYPANLMIGFMAEYESGELSLQKSELRKGGWFHRDRLPNIPGKVSLARRLLDAWIEGETI